jgi:excisionase family DNA binding protein
VNQERYMTPTECATYFGVGRRTVYRYIENGNLPRTRIGAKLFVRLSEAERFFCKEPTDVAVKQGRAFAT